MAFSPLRSKAVRHNRSLSWPSKPNPATSQLDANLSNLEGSEAPSCSSLSSMKNGVNSLTNLYTSIDDLLLLPNIQQIISQERFIDQVLDGYISLLDACSTAKDLVSNTKQDIQKLLSALRRKDVEGIRCYLISRRKLKKNFQKILRNKHILASSSSDKGHESTAIFCKLKEAESVTITVLESVLSYSIGARMQSGWSRVTKMMSLKKDEDAESNEFEKIDALLEKRVEGIQVEEHMNLVKEMERSIQKVEEELECLFRQLIKTRVFLLNILNH